VESLFNILHFKVFPHLMFGFNDPKSIISVSSFLHLKLPSVLCSTPLVLEETLNRGFAVCVHVCTVCDISGCAIMIRQWFFHSIVLCSVPADLIVRFIVGEVALEWGFLGVTSVFPCQSLLHHCSLLICHCPLRCAVALMRWHIITYSILI
jgi:hypothetical protein